jgi:hypothetical protein
MTRSCGQHLGSGIANTSIRVLDKLRLQRADSVEVAAV